MRTLVSLILLGILSCSQRSSDSNSVPVKISNNLDSVQTAVKEVILDKYRRFLPDTNKVFSDWEHLMEYTKPLQRQFDTLILENGNRMEFDSSDSSNFVKSKFSILLSTLFFKHIIMLDKDNLAMALLGDHNPYATAISVQDRLRIFNTFPINIKNSEVGLKSLSTIESYIYDRNLGTNFLKFKGISFYDSASQLKKLNQIFSGNKDYTLISFGASWCKPCLIQERKLKKYFSKLDFEKLEVIGISIDKSSDKFADFSIREGFPWKLFRISDGTDNTILKELGFVGIPRNFLIGKDGKILKEDLDIFEILKYLNIEIPEI